MELQEKAVVKSAEMYTCRGQEEAGSHCRHEKQQKHKEQLKRSKALKVSNKQCLFSKVHYVQERQTDRQ